MAKAMNRIGRTAQVRRSKRSMNRINEAGPGDAVPARIRAAAGEPTTAKEAPWFAPA
jgi:hypothetical protein